MFPEKIHFIGIGGIGVSAIAKLLSEEGILISGSDQTKSTITEEFAAKNIKISYQHNSQNILPEHQMVIYSPAISADNPELIAAQELGIPTLSYPQALGKLSENYYTIAISGTHGKSTTTAMLSLIAINEDLNPNIIIGTKLRELGDQNYRSGESNILIIEACEYKESFQYLSPDILAITNIEPDHLDYYKTAENYYRAFKNLIVKTAETGKVFLSPNAEIPRELASISHLINKVEAIDFKIALPGAFNIQNASLACGIARQLSVKQETIIQTLQKFTGTWRRFEYRNDILPNTTMIDDYGHHPNELKVTLNAIRDQHPDKKILLVFQPHQYSRTKYFLNEFAETLANSPVDGIIIPDIYEVRDTAEDLKSVSAQDLVGKINLITAGKAIFGEGLPNTAKILQANPENYEVIITMGAGNIENIYDLLKN